MIIPESKLDIWGISIASTKWIWNCLPGCSWCMYIRSRNWIFFPQTFLLIALNLFAETKSGRVAVLMNWLKFMRVHLDRYTSHLPVETSRVQFEQITFTHLRGEALWQSWIQTSLKILLSLKEKKEKKKFYTRMPNIDMTVRIHGTSARTIFSCHLMTSYFFSRQKEQRSEIRVGKKLMHLSNI